jgi:hypothetical protein
MISAAIIFFLLQDEIHGTGRFDSRLNLNRNGKVGIDVDQSGDVPRQDQCKKGNRDRDFGKYAARVTGAYFASPRESRDKRQPKP